MATPGDGSNVRLDGPLNVWWEEGTATEIHLTVNDSDVENPVTGQTGLHLAVSANPRSANFDPKTYNTLRHVLAQFEKPHPPEEADESIPRRLDRRRKHLNDS